MTSAIPPLPDTPPLPPHTPELTPKKRLNPLVAGLAGFALGAGLLGGIWAINSASGPTRPSEPETFTLTGTFMLTDGSINDGDGGCHGSGGYDDIAEGSGVTVYNAAGDVVATGHLGESTAVYGSCTFKVSVAGVPKGEKFYKVEVSHRGTVQMTGKEAESGAFSASLG